MVSIVQSIRGIYKPKDQILKPIVSEETIILKPVNHKNKSAFFNFFEKYAPFGAWQWGVGLETPKIQKPVSEIHIVKKQKNRTVKLHSNQKDN